MGIDPYKYYIASAIIYRFCWMMMVTLSMVYMYVVVGLDPLQMVLVGTVLEISAFVFEIPTGVVADTYSRKLSIVIGYIMMGSGFGIIAIWSSFEIVLLSQVIWGAGSTFLSGSNQAWISEEVGEEKANHGFVVASQWGSVGALGGIAVCIALGTWNIALPILIGSLGLIVLGVISQWLMTEERFTPTRAEDRQTWGHMADTFQSGLRLIRSNPMLWLIILIALFEGLNREGFDRLYVPLLIDYHAFPDLFGEGSLSWWGILAAGATVFSFLALSLVRKFVRTAHLPTVIRTLSAANALLFVSTGVFVATGDFYTAVLSYFAVVTLRSVIGPLTNVWLNRNLEPSSRATLFSMHAQARALGEMSSGPAIGAIGKFISIKAAILTSALVLIPILFMLQRATGHLRVKKGSEGVGPRGLK